MQTTNNLPIGIFDSGYGGLTVFKEIQKQLPTYDYLYLGDNARAPYGSRSFESIYQYTLEAVSWLFNKGCPLVVLACNTASAKALRSIQQINLPQLPDPTKRVLGVIRPTTEIVGRITKTNNIGILGTAGTISSQSYPMEMAKFWPAVKVYQQQCPMWVPLVENNEHESIGADYFIEKKINELLHQCSEIDTIIMACTHYPLLQKKIEQYLPTNTKLLGQGEIVAGSLKDYLQRHPEMESRLTKNQTMQFFTTDDALTFARMASIFYGENLSAQHVGLL